ncbi:MAG: UDP-glucose 4-epimerase GalE [Myxococcales bacterium]|nr:UDP-glucose 4-epimerase GalE [Myxococcales bacterium]
MRMLVTGGAGYIGSHMVRLLLDGGHQVVVLDDLSTGHRDAVADAARFVEGDIGRSDDVAALLRDESIDAVVNFAAKSLVQESVESPRRYWQGNTVATLGLLEAVLDTPSVKAFVQSSTAAVYGNPGRVPIDEDDPKLPVNPYGATKLAIEEALQAYGIGHGLRWAALRYFNAAGADVAANLAERHSPETHLIPIVLDVACGAREALTVFGSEWPTPDGTCVRDYVHVLDLCDAHMRAIEHLMAGRQSGAFNLGTGRGHSVREVVATAHHVTGREIRTVDAAPRAGDPAVLVANPDRAARVLGWRAQRASLTTILGDAWATHRRARPPA